MNNDDIVLEWLDEQTDPHAAYAARLIRSLIEHNNELRRELEKK